MTNFPEIRGLVRATPLADGRVTHDPEQVDCARSKPPPESARKRVLGVFFSRFTVCFGCLFLCEVHLPAQVWNGTTGVNWTTGANWAGGLAPVSTGTATFNAPTPFSPTINTAVATGSLLFTGTASQNFSGGNTLTLNGVGGVGINNQVNYAPTFANPITLGASQTWQAANAAGGGMTFNGTINLGANTLILGPQNVANSIRINRVIAGTGALNKTGVGSVVLTGANTFSGGTTVTAGTLQVGSATTTGSVSGNIANAGAVVFNRSNAHTYAGLISGTGSVTQAGAGTLTLTGANTYTGGTTINTGSTLQIGGGSTTGSITGDVVDNGTLIFNRSNALTFGGNISGSGAVTKIAAGTLTLSGDNSYTGVTTINAGTLVVSSSTALGSTAGGTTVANNAALELSNNISIGAESLSLSGDGSGSGASALGALRNLSGSNSFGGAVTLTAATRIRSDAGSLTLSGPVSAANFSLSVTGPGDTIIQGAVALGSGGIVKGAAAADTGTVVLSGNNSYSGPTTVSFGTLVAASNNALGSTAGVTTVASGASLGVQGGITLTGEAMTINGTGLGGNGAIRNLSGLNTLTGPVTLSGNSEIQSDAGSLSLSGGVTGTNRTLTLDGAGNTSLTGNVTLGSGGIIKNGTGLAVLSGTNSYSGGTTINAGTVRATGGNAIGNASTVTLADVAGATLDLAGSSETIGSLTGGGATGGNVTLGAGTLTTGTATSTTYGGVISGTGGLTKVGTGVFTLTGNNTYTGLTTVSAGTLQIGSGGTSGSIAGDIIDNSLLQFNRSDSLVVNGNVTGSGRIIQVGAGTTTLNGNNVLSALSGNAVSVNAGTLMMNGGSYRANVNDGKAIVVTNANTQLNGVTVMTTDGGGSGSSASTSGAFGVSVSGPATSMTGSNYGAAGSRLRASLLVAASKRGIRAAHRSNRQRLGSHKGRAVANRSTV